MTAQSSPSQFPAQGIPNYVADLLREAKCPRRGCVGGRIEFFGGSGLLMHEPCAWCADREKALDAVSNEALTESEAPHPTPRTDALATHFASGGKWSNQTRSFEAEKLYEHARKLERELADHPVTELRRVHDALKKQPFAIQAALDIDQIGTALVRAGCPPAKEPPVVPSKQETGQAFKHDPDACGIDIRTGEDGTWITLTTKRGSSASFQPITLLTPKSDHDIVARIAQEWCAERTEEASKGNSQNSEKGGN